MHGDEHIGARRAGAVDAIAQLEEFVVIAGEHGAHARFGVDTLRECARDRQRHVLLTRAAVADGTRILAAVTGVHGDDDIAVALIGRVHSAHPHCDRRGCHCRRRLTHIHHQLRLTGSARPGAAGAEWRAHLQHHPQRPTRLCPQAYGGDHPERGRYVQTLTAMRLRQVNHHAVRMLQQEDFLGCRHIQIERDLRGGCVRRDPDRAQLRRKERTNCHRTCDRGGQR